MWQKIETAPKDGTEIDVLDIYGVRWTGVSWRNFYREFLPVGSLGHGCEHVPAPTHWMPLPPPTEETNHDPR